MMATKRGTKSVAGRKAAPRSRQLLFRLVAVSCSLVLGLIAAELVVRLVGIAPVLPEQYADYIHDPYLPYVRRPSSVIRGTSGSKEYDYEYRHNSQGFRDVEHSFEKPDDVFRILALGDSFTYGVGADFEATYLYGLERLLNARGQGHAEVEIVKAGVPRYFPEIERLQLEHYGIRYRPDLVLVAFSSNDLPDTIRGIDALRPTSQAGYLVSKRSKRIGALGTWLYVRSEAARAVLSAYLSRTEEPKKKVKPLEDITGKDVEQALKKIEQEYDRMYAISKSNGASFVVVSIPRDPTDVIFGHLAKMLEKKPYQLIDLLPDIRAASRSRPTQPIYWPKDAHCTPRGYAVISKALFRKLTERQIVP